MYTWIIDYVYMIVIIAFFLLLPFYSDRINKYLFKNKNIYSAFVINMFIFSIMIVGLLYLREFHIDTILNICFDMPVIMYKDNIPQGCYGFDMSKYQGVGWLVTAMFWIVLEVLYFLVIIFIKKLRS